MTAVHLAPGEARLHPMIDGDHVAKAVIHGPSRPFEDGAGRFFADFAGSVPPTSRSRSRWRPSSRCRSATAWPLRARE